MKYVPPEVKKNVKLARGDAYMAVTSEVDDGNYLVAVFLLLLMPWSDYAFDNTRNERGSGHSMKKSIRQGGGDRNKTQESRDVLRSAMGWKQKKNNGT